MPSSTSEDERGRVARGMEMRGGGPMPSTERRKTRNVATAVKEVFDGLVSVAISSARARWKHGEHLRPGHDAAGQRRSRHR